MAKQGFYGPEYVRDKNGDYDYLGQVNRLHNLKQWDRQVEPIAAAPATISLDEMQERWKAYDWLLADNKHFESAVIKKVDELAQKRRTPDTHEYKSQHLQHHINKLRKYMH